MKNRTILEELKSREPIFHRPEFGTTRADFDALMVDGYFEIGASGKRYEKDFILDMLEERYSKPIEEDLVASDFECVELGGDNYLITYNLVQNKVRKTHRATLWKKVDDDWKIVYHQGTIILE